MDEYVLVVSSLFKHRIFKIIIRVHCTREMWLSVKIIRWNHNIICYYCEYEIGQIVTSVFIRHTQSHPCPCPWRLNNIRLILRNRLPIPRTVWHLFLRCPVHPDNRRRFSRPSLDTNRILILSSAPVAVKYLWNTYLRLYNTTYTTISLGTTSIYIYFC